MTQLSLSTNGKGPRDHRSAAVGQASIAERALVPREDLTTTELVVAILLARGLRQWEVADVMNSSVEVVRSHTARIRDKTGARSTCHAVAELIRLGVIE